MKKKSGFIRLVRGLLALTLAAALICPAASAAPEGAVVWGYSEGLAQCELDGKWGYVDSSRQVVIPIQYDSIVSFSLGLAAVNLGGKLGVIRQDGSYLIPPEYDTLMPIDCGLYIAQKGAKWGVVSIVPFSDGAGGTTNVLYDLAYDKVEIVTQGGVQVLTLTLGESSTKIPLFDLPRILVEKQVPSARFPLTRNRLPSFSDVSPRAWYSLWVDIAYNVGLIAGTGGNQFSPNQSLTVAQALKLAATLESRYKDDSFHLTASTGAAWYLPAVDYCLASGIITSGQFSQSDYNRPITRAEMAAVFAATSPAKAMPQLNDPDRVRASVPDVSAALPQAEAIYAMYVKGILSGVDSKLTYRPYGTVTRAEAAAIVARMARAEQRLTLWSDYTSSDLVS